MSNNEKAFSIVFAHWKDSPMFLSAIPADLSVFSSQQPKSALPPHRNGKNPSPHHQSTKASPRHLLSSNCRKWCRLLFRQCTDGSWDYEDYRWRHSSSYGRLTLMASTIDALRYPRTPQDRLTNKLYSASMYQKLDSCAWSCWIVGQQCCQSQCLLSWYGRFFKDEWGIYAVLGGCEALQNVRIFFFRSHRHN